MSRMVQVYNPVHGQRISQSRLNVMGRVLEPQKIRTISVLLDKQLIRKVRPAQSGAFECRMDLSHLAPGKHEIEIRTLIGHRTERQVTPIYKVAEEGASEEAQVADANPVNGAEDLNSSASPTGNV